MMIMEWYAHTARHAGECRNRPVRADRFNTTKLWFYERGYEYIGVPTATVYYTNTRGQAVKDQAVFCMTKWPKEMNRNARVVCLELGFPGACMWV